jgi:predicted RNase H-like HicB family nuclease
VSVQRTATGRGVWALPPPRRVDLRTCSAADAKWRGVERLYGIGTRSGTEDVNVVDRGCRPEAGPRTPRDGIFLGTRPDACERESVMIRTYLDAALKRARYTQLEDGSYCAEVRGLRGVVATGRSLESCRGDLQEVVEEWILVRVARGLDVPALGGKRIRIRKAG